MEIERFGLERWLVENGEECKYNLSQTYVDTLSLQKLLDISGNKDFLEEFLNKRLIYGESQGFLSLREKISELYTTMEAKNIHISKGCIGGNELVFKTLLEPGDRVVVPIPTYQQHYSYPKALGGVVKTLNLRPENTYLPDLEELESLMNKNTKLICLCNPNNPTGVLMDKKLLSQIVDIAIKYDAYILCDEAYRGLNHKGDTFTESICDLYEKGISTSSVSKILSSPGLRTGWIATNRNLIKKISVFKDYDTISCGLLNQEISHLALKNLQPILHKNRQVILENIKIIDDWIQGEERFSYVKPQAGTVAFLKLHMNMNSKDFCKSLLKKEGVLLVPGSAYEREGYIRLGYACDREVLKEGLKKITAFAKKIQ